MVAEHGYDVIGDLRDLVPLRPADSTDPARAAYDQRVDVLTAALVGGGCRGGPAARAAA